MISFVDHRRALANVGIVALAMGSSVVAARFLTSGEPLLVVLLVGALVALPGFVMIHRDPFAGVLVWVGMNQFLVEGSGGIERKLYWLIHRGLPVGVVAVLVVGGHLGLRRFDLPRLGIPEFLMGGYVIVTLWSIAQSSDQVMATTWHAYDRIIAPMMLYVAVRLLRISTRDLRRLTAVLGFVIAVQAVIGALSWFAPWTLPGAWLVREGSRTIGSLGHPNVFGVVMITGALLLLHREWSLEDARDRSRARSALVVVAGLMVFLTFGRANWLAAVPAGLGVLVLYPRRSRRAMLLLVPVVFALVSVGTLGSFGDLARERFLSDQSSESALSRLPVVMASIRMYDERPLTGWGYGNFDRYDFRFQGSVDGVFVPDKDHASHNLYLTILAEQGALGLALYLGPAAWWLARTRSRNRSLPADGLRSRRLIWLLWLALAAHLVVNNFSNMKVVYGLGMWWLTLGLIASVLEQSQSVPDAPTDVEVLLAGGVR